MKTGGLGGLGAGHNPRILGVRNSKKLVRGPRGSGCGKKGRLAFLGNQIRAFGHQVATPGGQGRWDVGAGGLILHVVGGREGGCEVSWLGARTGPGGDGK